MKDILGKALLDYHNGNYSEDILTETNISEEDPLPLAYLFRSYAEMPTLEQKALDICKGHTLDVGCGAGSHALYLQEKGIEVTAIDISEGAVQVTSKRGVLHAHKTDILNLSQASFDTILLLMNGTGIFQNIDKAPYYLRHLKSLLKEGGQILIDSSDLQYMYDTNEDGSIWVPGDRYYGELEFTMSYLGEKTEVFPWLYLDESRFATIATIEGFLFEVIKRGKNFDYLARLTAAEHNHS